MAANCLSIAHADLETDLPHTSPHRELYTFFSTSGKSATKRVELVDFSDAGTSTLLNFDVANAHCYSPEDEAKLRSIIESGGASVFNAMIREGVYTTCARGWCLCSALPFFSPRARPRPMRQLPPARPLPMRHVLSVTYHVSDLICAPTTVCVACVSRARVYVTGCVGAWLVL
eukprot:COSAG02_NODE_7605_length_2937_cov_2.178999_5_plen_173_part_00